MASDREKILELITKTMNEYDYREPSEEYASHEMLLLISRIKELPAGRYRLIDEVAIEELWDEWVDCLEGQDKEQVTMILTASGLERTPQTEQGEMK
jgi:hypothetical protein